MQCSSLYQAWAAHICGHTGEVGVDLFLVDTDPQRRMHTAHIIPYLEHISGRRSHEVWTRTVALEGDRNSEHLVHSSIQNN